MSQATVGKKRNAYFDNAKLYLIFLVVLGHVISPVKGNNNVLFTLYSLIFLFHMPAFIFISGFFTKNYKKKKFISKSVKTILLPYLLFQVIYSVFYYWNNHEKTFSLDLLDPHWTLWFLLSLFCWNLLLYVFAPLRWKGFFLSVILGVGIGYLADIGGYLSLSRTFVFLPFFLLGHLVTKEQLQKLKSISKSWLYGAAIIIIMAITIAYAFPKEATPWLLGSSSYADMGSMHLYDGFIRLAQYGITLIVLMAFLVIIPNQETRLTTIGQRTLYVYLLHGFIIKLSETYLPDSYIDQVSDHYVLLIIFSLLICLTLGSYVVKRTVQPLIEFRINS